MEGNLVILPSSQALGQLRMNTKGHCVAAEAERAVLGFVGLQAWWKEAGPPASAPATVLCGPQTQAGSDLGSRRAGELLLARGAGSAKLVQSLHDHPGDSILNRALYMGPIWLDQHSPL